MVFGITNPINAAVITSDAEKKITLILSYGPFFCILFPPQFPQRRQQQKSKPIIGMNRIKRIPIAKQTTIPIP